MKVILTENVDRVGKIGDVVTVAEGYARNFLLPRKLAKEATAGNMKMLDALKKKKEAADKVILDAATALAEKLGALSLTIGAQAGEEEKLFGSVSNEHIAEALLVENIKVDKKDIIIEEQIKKLGVYQVMVKLHPEVKAKLRVWVVKKE